jgi:hypothetical protein
LTQPLGPLLKPPYSGIPGPFGQAAAIDSVGGVAAPLLAGFAFVLIGLILQSSTAFRWPDVGLALLMLAALLLIAAVELAFSARRFYIPPSEWEGWERLASPGREEHLNKQVEFFLQKHSRRLARTRYAYNFGVIALFLATAATLVPPGPIGDIKPWRLAAISLALLGFVLETCLTLKGELQRSWMQLHNRSPHRYEAGAKKKKDPPPLAR